MFFKVFFFFGGVVLVWSFGVVVSGPETKTRECFDLGGVNWGLSLDLLLPPPRAVSFVCKKIGLTELGL